MGTNDVRRRHTQFVAYQDLRTGNVTYDSLDWDSYVHRETRTTRVRQPLPSGWRMPKPYSLNVTSDPAPIGYYEYKPSSSYLYRYSNELRGPSVNYAVINPIPATGLAERAEIKALLALKDQSVNLGVAFAEAQQTADLVAGVTRGISRAIKLARRGRFKDAIRSMGLHPSDFSNSFLGVQYGFRPLMADVFGSVEALKKQPPHHWVITTKGTARDQVNDYLPTVVGSYGCRFQVSGKRTAGVYVRLDFEPSNTFFSSLSSVGMTNPLEIIWEKVPFSLVADWFIPIGDWLSAMDATLGWRFKSGSCSTLRRVDHVISSAGPQGNYLGGQFYRHRKQIILNRSVYSSVPFPKFPSIRNPLSLERAANGIALLKATTRVR